MKPMRWLARRLVAPCLAWSCLSLPLLAAGAASVTPGLAPNHTPNLTLYTEEYPPINFSVDGHPSGLSTEVVQEILRRTATQAPIEVVPWARGFRAALETPNVGLFVTMRTPEREAHFKWVGPVTTVLTSFYSAHGSTVTVHNLDDARHAPLIVVPREWYSHQALRAMGFTNLEPVTDPDVMLRMALNGRAALLVADNQTLPAQLAHVGATAAAVDRHYTFMKTSSYIAFSLGTPDTVVKQWQQALDAMKRDGSFARIYGHWLPGEKPPGIEAEPDLVPH